MPQLILKAYTIDGVSYTNSLLDIPTNATSNLLGTSNQYRSQISFNRLDLRQIIGNDMFDKYQMFNIKLQTATPVYENNSSTIGRTNSMCLRTSSVYIGGLKFLNSERSCYVGMVSSVDPTNYYHICLPSSTVEGVLNVTNRPAAGFYGDNAFFFKYSQQSQNMPELFRMYNVFYTQGSFNGALLTMTAMSAQTNGAYTISCTADNGSSVKNTFNGDNRYLEIIPAGNEWFLNRGQESLTIQNETVCSTNYCNEDDWFQTTLTFMKNPDPLFDFSIELRDINTNLVQPVVPTSASYPSFIFVFDIQPCDI